jgi:hypothetical protein
MLSVPPTLQEAVGASNKPPFETIIFPSLLYTYEPRIILVAPILIEPPFVNDSVEPAPVISTVPTLSFLYPTHKEPSISVVAPSLMVKDPVPLLYPTYTVPFTDRDEVPPETETFPSDPSA